MTTVAEDGNRRVGDATPDEIRQCALDIKSWFERSSSFAAPSGAEQSDFQRLEKALDLTLPAGLEILLSVIDGGIWFMDKKLLSVEKIIRAFSYVDSSKLWKPEYIPFCGDASGMIIIDTDSGEVLEWDEDDGVGESLGASFPSFLESYRDDILGSHMEFIEDCGVIEKMTGSKSKK